MSSIREIMVPTDNALAVLGLLLITECSKRKVKKKVMVRLNAKKVYSNVNLLNELGLIQKICIQ